MRQFQQKVPIETIEAPQVGGWGIIAQCDQQMLYDLLDPLHRALLRGEVPTLQRPSNPTYIFFYPLQSQKDKAIGCKIRYCRGKASG